MLEKMIRLAIRNTPCRLSRRALKDELFTFVKEMVERSEKFRNHLIEEFGEKFVEDQSNLQGLNWPELPRDDPVLLELVSNYRGPVNPMRIIEFPTGAPFTLDVDSDGSENITADWKLLFKRAVTGDMSVSEIKKYKEIFESDDGDVLDMPTEIDEKQHP